MRSLFLSLSFSFSLHTHLFFRIFSVFFPRQFAAKVELWAAFHCFKSPSKFRFPIPVAFTIQVAVPAPVLVAVQVLVPLSHSESLTHSLPWRFKMLAIKCKIIEFLIDSIDAAHSIRFFHIHCNWGQYNYIKLGVICKNVYNILNLNKDMDILRHFKCHNPVKYLDYIAI